MFCGISEDFTKRLLDNMVILASTIEWKKDRLVGCLKEDRPPSRVVKFEVNSPVSGAQAEAVQRGRRRSGAPGWVRRPRRREEATGAGPADREEIPASSCVRASISVSSGSALEKRFRKTEGLSAEVRGEAQMGESRRRRLSARPRNGGGCARGPDSGSPDLAMPTSRNAEKTPLSLLETLILES